MKDIHSFRCIPIGYYFGMLTLVQRQPKTNSRWHKFKKQTKNMLVHTERCELGHIWRLEVRVRLFNKFTHKVPGYRSKLTVFFSIKTSVYILGVQRSQLHLKNYKRRQNGWHWIRLVSLHNNTRELHLIIKWISESYWSVMVGVEGENTHTHTLINTQSNNRHAETSHNSSSLLVELLLPKWSTENVRNLLLQMAN